MNSLGIRVTSSTISFSVYNKENKTIISEKQILPELDLPKKLKQVREDFLAFINKHNITNVGIKIAEKNALSINLERIAIEGVLQEAIASSNIKSYSIYSLQSIAKTFGIKSKDFKPLATDAEVFQKFIADKITQSNLRTNNEQREAILLAIAAS
jgi:L-rhamnose mutarotase